MISLEGIVNMSKKTVLGLSMLGALASCKSPVGPDPPKPVDNPPGVVVDLDDRIFGSDTGVNVKFTDDNGLVSAFLEVGDNRYDFDVAGLKSKEEVINHEFNDTGDYSWRAEVKDDSGKITSLTGGVYVVPKKRFEVQGRGFWNKESGFVDQMTLRNLELGEDYVLNPDGSGVFGKDVFEGLYVIKDVKGKFYDVSRMLVDRDLVSDNDQFKDGNEFTYLVSGLEGTPWLINLDKDMSASKFHVETVDIEKNVYTNQDLLENISRLAHQDGFIVTPRFWETQTIVVNKGNPDFPDDFEYRRDHLNNSNRDPNDPSKTLPAGGRYPPGTKFGDEELNNIDDYIKDMNEIFNSDVIGINPYTIDVVKDTAENLTGFFTRSAPYPLISADFKKNVLYIGGNGENIGTESVYFNKQRDPSSSEPWFVDASGMLVSAKLFGINNANNTWMSNESKHFGTVREAGPKICSVKDGFGDFEVDSSTLPEYCRSLFTSPDGRSFKPVDKLAWKLFTGFSPWAGRQLNKEYFNKSDQEILDSKWNAPNTQKGFNVYIQK